MYCERVAPGEASRTCREAGARAVFEKKIQEEDTWKIYKWAYKKLRQGDEGQHAPRGL